jgi:hypothetical protein
MLFERTASIQSVCTNLWSYRCHQLVDRVNMPVTMSQSALQDLDAVIHCKGQQTIGNDQACGTAQHTWHHEG